MGKCPLVGVVNKGFSYKKFKCGFAQFHPSLLAFIPERRRFERRIPIKFKDWGKCGVQNAAALEFWEKMRFGGIILTSQGKYTKSVIRLRLFVILLRNCGVTREAMYGTHTRCRSSSRG